MNTIKVNGATHINIGTKTVAQALENSYAIDSFEKISDIAYLWRRKTFIPVTQMKMHLTVPGMATSTSISSSDFEGAEIPLFTYTQTKDATVALIATCRRDSLFCSCSNQRKNFCHNHIIKWPKEDGFHESPYDYMKQVLSKEGEQRDTFEAIIVAYETEDGKKNYERLLDFARQYFADPQKKSCF